MELPLDLKGSIGAIGFKDRQLLDDQLAFQDSFKYNGVKGGLGWKEAVGREIISRAPIMRKLIKWAEDMDTRPMSEEMVFRAVGDRMTEDQIYNMNSCIWGFTAKARGGPAKNRVDGAKDLNGLDAWTRIVAYITSGKGVQLEDMRR